MGNIVNEMQPKDVALMEMNSPEVSNVSYHATPQSKTQRPPIKSHNLPANTQVSGKKILFKYYTVYGSIITFSSVHAILHYKTHVPSINYSYNK